LFLVMAFSWHILKVAEAHAADAGPLLPLEHTGGLLVRQVLGMSGGGGGIPCSEARSEEVIAMDTPTLNRRRLSLGARLMVAIVACMAIPLVWVAVTAVAVADGQRSKLGELEQARVRWEARPFSGYRVLIQLQPRGGSACEKIFEVDESAQTKTSRDSCSNGSMANYLFESLGSPGTVPGLFDYIETEVGRVGECGFDGCACDGRRTIDAVYDTALGYPKRFEVGSYKDWSTVGLCLGQRPAAPLGGPVTVSVNPIE
jgi:hypothetical protein